MTNAIIDYVSTCIVFTYLSTNNTENQRLSQHVILVMEKSHNQLPPFSKLRFSESFNNPDQETRGNTRTQDGAQDERFLKK